MEIIKSIFGGQISEFTYRVSGYVMDKFINPSYSNLIALLLGAIVNFNISKECIFENIIIIHYYC